MRLAQTLLMSLFTVLCLPAAWCADALQVTYIGTNDAPLQNARAAESYDIKLTVYNLDGHRNLEKELSDNLPPDLAQAEIIANERLKAMDGKRVQDAFKGVALSIQWDLRKAPATVFGDGQQVIYGVTDLDEALKRYRYFRVKQYD